MPIAEPVLTDAEVLRYLRPAVLVLDDSGLILQAEGVALSMIGFTAEAMIGTNALDHVAPGHLDPIMFVFAGTGDHVVRNRHAPFPLELIGPDGNTLVVDCAAERAWRDDKTLWIVTMMPHVLQSASFHALTAYGRGASAHEVAEIIAERLSWQWDPAAEIRSFVLADAVDGVFTTVSEPAIDGRRDRLSIALGRHVSDAAPWHDELGAPHRTVPVEHLPRPIAAAARAAGFEVACIAIGHLDGRPELGLVSFGGHSSAFDGNLHVIMTESVKTLDMSLRREGAENELRRIGEEDALTGLSNRRTFAQALDARRTTTSAVLYIDLDRFKEINDSYGHVVGDEVLVEIGRRIRSMCRPDDVIARLGGDEFAVLLADVDPTYAERISHRVLARICDPLPDGLGPARIGASGGLALGVLEDDAVERADLAMLASKRAGRGQLIVA